jgi:hypothetical protein
MWRWQIPDIPVNWVRAKSQCEAYGTGDARSFDISALNQNCATNRAMIKRPAANATRASGDFRWTSASFE